MSTKKQSSIDWLHDNLTKVWYDVNSSKDLLKQAKAMHKEEVAKAYDDAIMKGRQEDGNEYYNETFNSDEA